jgi:ABC-type multidrug transport system permease subunit
MAGFVPAQEFIAFLLMPMMFLGCPFFSYAMLPDPWNIVALLLPTTYLRNAHKITSSSARMNFRCRCGFIGTVRIP